MAFWTFNDNLPGGKLLRSVLSAERKNDKVQLRGNLSTADNAKIKELFAFIGNGDTTPTDTAAGNAKTELLAWLDKELAPAAETAAQLKDAKAQVLNEFM